MPQILRAAAFTADPEGGNPAGIVLGAEGLSEAEMLRIAAEIDDAETAFVTGLGTGALALRYFSPIAEVPFCGHATIATAVTLVERGLAPAGALVFRTPVGEIAIETNRSDAGIRASFTSVEPHLEPLDPATLARVLEVLGLSPDELDERMPPAISYAGNRHPILVIGRLETFDGFGFDPAAARALMDEQGWPGTITVLHLGSSEAAGGVLAPGAVIEARNVFPVGRITEDPATGSAAAATGAYLRERGAVVPPASVTIRQGRHVGRPSELIVEIPPTGPITVSGTAVPLPR